MAELLSDKIRLNHVRDVVKEIEIRGTPQKETDTELVDRFKKSSEKLAVTMTELFPGRTGCVVSVAKPGNDGYWVLWEAGDDSGGRNDSLNELEKNKIDKHTEFAIGKTGVCLMNGCDGSVMNLTLPENERLLIEDSKDTWVIPGGAVTINDLVITCSGYPTGPDDEAFCLALAVDSKFITKERAIEMAREKFKNTRFEEIVDKIVK